MQELNFEEVVERIVEADPRYTREAYGLLREALDYTQQQIHKKSRGQIRHVTGQELLEGIREHVLQQFGPMSITVLEEWGIRNTRDIGEVVFNMVENRLLAKTEEDSRADFNHGYDFDEAFRKPFLPKSRLQPKPPTRAVKPKPSEPKA
ncbi:MAG: hypothetical protein MUE94_07190 [Verrucomicrobia bacterium]|jgi:uncharacterized repeat protein (TIGR04138 family)|nr:hypothetical protein [Verrucomicrobiota bacterium]